MRHDWPVAYVTTIYAALVIAIIVIGIGAVR